MLERAAALHPGDARIWQILGLAHRNRDDLAPAVAAFEKSTALAPADPLIAHSLARTSLEAGLPAAGLFERALRLAPDDAQVLVGRAAAQLAEDGVDQAIAGLEARLARNPLWLEGHGTLARLRWLTGEREDFAASFEAAAAAAPREVKLWRAWADTLMHANLYEGTLALIERGRAAAGAHLAFDVLEAIVIAEQGDRGATAVRGAGAIGQ